MPDHAQQRQDTQTIRRVLKRRDLILFGLVIVGPTAPLPVYGILQSLSHGQAALSYLVAMVAMLFTAISYGRMATAYPSAGSTYTYVQRSLHPYIGFLAGWSMILDYFLLPLIGIIYPALTAARLFPAVPYFVWVIVFTLGITVINVLGVHTLSKANTAMMVAMVGTMMLLLALAVRSIVRGHGAVGLLSLSGLYPSGHFAVSPMMLGASVAALSYIGFDAISTLAEDSVAPKKDIGVATVLVCMLQTAICVATVYVIALATRGEQSFAHADTAILDIGQQLGGRLLFLALTLVLLVAGISCALTGQAGSSRLLFAMGRDGVIPHRIFGRLHPRFGTPTRALYITSALLLVFALLSQFEIAVEMLNFGAFVGFILVNLSVVQHFWIRGRERSGQAWIKNLLLPLCGAGVCAYVWLSLSRDAKLAGFLWLLLGVLYLALHTRGFRRAMRTFGQESAHEYELRQG